MISYISESGIWCGWSTSDDQSKVCSLCKAMRLCLLTHSYIPWPSTELHMALKHNVQGFEGNIQDNPCKQISLKSNEVRSWNNQIFGPNFKVLYTQPLGTNPFPWVSSKIMDWWFCRCPCGSPKFDTSASTSPSCPSPAVPQPSSQKNIKNIGYNCSALSRSKGTLIQNTLLQTFGFAWQPQEHWLLSQYAKPSFQSNMH